MAKKAYEVSSIEAGELGNVNPTLEEEEVMEGSEQKLSFKTKEEEANAVNGHVVEYTKMGADQEEAVVKKSETVSDFKPAAGMQKTVGLVGGISIIVGTMIGSGIFASPSSVANNAGSVGSTLLIWCGSGLIAMLGALCYIELGTMIQKSGGEYAYYLQAYGDMAAFIFSYASSFILRPAGFAAIAIACGDYIVEPFYGLEETSEKVMVAKFIGAGVIGIIVFVNCASVKWATRIQVIFTAAKLFAIGMLIITGLVRLGQGHDDSFKNAFNGTSKSISKIGYAFYGGLWAYDGWNNLNYVTEELKNPIRDLPLAIMIGIPLVTGCYVLVNIAYLTVLSSAEIATSSAVAVTLANRLYGVMAWVIPVFVACSTFGAANGTAFTSGRLVYVSAREGHMPKLLAMVHTKRHTPLPALIFTCIISWIMLIPESSNFEKLITYFNFAAWMFYGATIAALLWLRFRQPDLKRPYKVFILIPCIVLLCSIYLVVAPFFDNPVESAYCLLFILAGIPIYFAFVKYKILPKKVLAAFDAFTHKMQVLGDLALPESEEEIAG